VIERAKLVLAELEAIDRTAPTRRLADDLPLFSAARAVSPAVRTDPAAAALLDAMAALNPDDLSPREALEALYALKLKAAKTDR